MRTVLHLWYIQFYIGCVILTHSVKFLHTLCILTHRMCQFVHTHRQVALFCRKMASVANAIFVCKILAQKLWSCKKIDKYFVWTCSTFVIWAAPAGSPARNNSPRFYRPIYCSIKLLFLKTAGVIKIWKNKSKYGISNTPSLGSLWAPTSSWRPFKASLLRTSHPQAGCVTYVDKIQYA